MREDPWEFDPSHTLIMFSNHRPAIRGHDLGIWRRVRLVPWEVTIPADEQDTDLARKLHGEAAGILAWIVDGARRFLAEGLAPPEHVRAATEQYRTDEDVVGRFVADVLEVGLGFAYSVDIKAELTEWCEEQDVPTPPSMNDIAAVLRQLGARDGGRKQYRGKRSTIWHGVSIREKAL
jgi:putative DNA primase/helicase